MTRNCYSASKVSVMAIFVFILIKIVSAEGAKVALSVEEIKQLIPKIEAAEKNLLNVKIEAEAWMEESELPSGPWGRTPVYISATSWFDGLPKGKARVDVHTEISKGYWVDKSRYIYSEKSYMACYDGQFGRMIYHKNGEEGKPISVKRCELLNYIPKVLNGRGTGVVTGQRFTTNYFFVDREGRESFSQYFKTAISPEALKMDAFEFVREEYNGVQCIRFGLKASKSVRMNWWFDPSRGFALLGYENVSKNEEGAESVVERIKVNKLKKVSDDMWWPVEGTIESDRRKPGEPYNRTVYKAIDIVANDPNFDESMFSVSFPTGYTVDDKVNNRKYKITEDPNSR